MVLHTLDIIRVLASLSLLLFATHLFGFVFEKLHQPRVVGEVVGGIALGPSLLGWLSPSIYGFVFVDSEAVETVLAAIYLFGLMFLMFCAGIEINFLRFTKFLRLSMSVALAGIILPFSVGLLLFEFGIFQSDSIIGEANNEFALTLIVCIAMAVTSIPVISRIMVDLELMQTNFAKVIISAALLEDLALYVILAFAISLVASHGERFHGVFHLYFGSESAILSGILFVAVNLGFVIVSLTLGQQYFRIFTKNNIQGFYASSPLTFCLLVMLAITSFGLFLGVVEIIAAFVAGIIVRQIYSDKQINATGIKQFSYAFFIPIYFGIVGLNLNLIENFDFNFFATFFIVACFSKTMSVYIASRLNSEKPRTAFNIAVAMNARGGPGIVLATVAFSATIINDEFFVTLILLAIISSSISGAWLRRVRLEIK